MADIQLQIPLTTDQWNNMSQAQQQAFLKDYGFFDKADAATANGDYITWTLSDTQTSSSSAPKKPSTAGSAGKGLGAIAAGVGIKAGKDAIFGSGATEAAGEALASNASQYATPALPGGSIGTFDAAFPVSTLPSGEVGLASGGVAPAGTLPTPAPTGVSTLATVGGALAALHGGYGLYKGFGKGDIKSGAMSGAETGAGIGTMIAPGIGTLIGAGAGLVGGGLLGAIKTGKHKDQIARDQLRTYLQGNGIVDDGYNITLANGVKYNIGKDGSAKPEYGTDPGTGRTLRAYELPLSPDELQHQSVGWALPIATVLTGGDKKLTEDLTGYLAKGAMSNAGGSLENSRKNLLAVFEKMGITPEQANSQLDQLAASGAIDANRASSLKYGLGTLNSGKYFSNELERFKNSQTAQSPGSQPTTPAPSPISSPANTILQGGTGGVRDRMYIAGRDGPTYPSQTLADTASQKPTRTTTRSPGISLSGNRINYSDEEQKKRQNKALMSY